MRRYRRLLLGAAFYASLVVAGSFGITDKLLDLLSEKYGLSAKERLMQWTRLDARAAQLDEAGKLVLVNAFFNRLPNVDDIQQWGENDYWATPVELLASNGGDCEDFAIAKYFTLRDLGVSPERLRITYVKAFLRPQGIIQAHMVLAYYPTPDAEPLILDNVVADIRPSSARGDLLPVYSFDAENLWLAKEQGRGRPVENSGSATRWLDLMQRLQRQAAPRLPRRL